jgi:hypothetical protein
MAEKGKGLWHEKARPMAEKYCNAIMIFLCFFFLGGGEEKMKRREDKRMAILGLIDF